MTDSMIERVAREHYGVRQRAYKLPAWEELGPADRALEKVAARAAIEAMREPTDDMLEAGKIPTRPVALGNGTYTEGLGLGAHSSIVWPRMIEAALK